MIWQTKNPKKIFLVLLSVVLGGIVIFGALVFSGIIGKEKAPAPSDEWKDGLSAITEPIVLARVKKSNVENAGPSMLATTTTDILAGKLLAEYARTQKNSNTQEMSDADAQEIASTLAQEVTLPAQKQYTLDDLNISKDNTYNANLLYVQTLSIILKNFMATSQEETELTILVKVMDTNNSSLLSKLDARVIIYQKLIENLIALKVPSNVAPVHLRFIQAYEKLRASTVGFKKILSDPFVGIASLGEYRVGGDALILAEEDLRKLIFTKK